MTLPAADSVPAPSRPWPPAASGEGFLRIIGLLAMMATLLGISRYNYLLFHALAEIFSIAVAWGVFMLVWNARRIVANEALVILGTAYLFIGLIDLLHTLAYKGMGVFPDERGADPATQLWIVARTMESISLLAFTFLIGRKARLSWAWAIYTAATGLAVAAILVWPVFPDCFVEGVGLTSFKKGSEYLICLILMAALVLLHRKQPLIDAPVFPLLKASIALTILGELAFTFYLSVYGVSNLVGHLAKILSFFLVYLALIRTGLNQPYEVLFRNWRRSEDCFKKLIDAAPLSIMGFDAQGTVTYVNPFHLKTFAADKHEADFFVGKKIHELPGIVRAGIAESIARVLQGEEVSLGDVYFPQFTGGHRGHQSIRAVPFYHEDKVTGGILLREDASLLKCYEQRLTRVLSTTRDAFWVVDSAGRFLEANAAMVAMTGYDLEELTNMHVWDIEVEETAAQARRRMARIEQKGYSRFESRHRRKDGTIFDVEVSISLVPDSGSQMVAFVRDITARKLRQEELQHSEEKFSRAFYHSPQLMAISTIDEGSYLDVNDAFVRTTGYAREELVGKSSTELGLISEADRLGLKDHLLHHGKIIGEALKLKKRDGSAVICEYWGEIIQVGGQHRLLSIARDITAVKQAEHERDATVALLQLINRQSDLDDCLREAAEFLHRYSSCEAVGIRLEEDGKFPYVQTLGFPSQFQTSGNRFCSSCETGGCFKCTDGKPAMDCICSEVIRGRCDPALPFFTEAGSFWTNSASELLDADDATCRFRPRRLCSGGDFESVALVPLRYGGKTLGLLQLYDTRPGRFHDDAIQLFERLAGNLAVAVKERRDFQALQQSERRYRNLFEYAPVGIFTSLSTGHIVDINPEMRRIVGCVGPAEARERFTDLERQLHADPQRHKAFLAELQAEGQVRGFEYEALNADGRRLWLRTDARIVETREDGVFTIEGFSTDITTRRKAQDALAKERSLLKAVFTTTPDCFVLKDADGIYRSVNPAFCRFLGKGETEIVGRTDFDLFPEDDARQYGHGDQEVFENGETQDIDWPVLGAEGRRWLRVVKTPVHSADGQVEGVLCSVSDITQRRRMEALLRARLRLSEHADAHSLDQVLRKTLDAAEEMTDSRRGFFHFVTSDQCHVNLQVWSTKTLQAMSGRAASGRHYPVEKAGAWADCVRRMQPVIHNNSLDPPHAKGLWPEHAPVARELVVPVTRDGLVTAILGLADKSADYSEEEVAVVIELANMAWDIVLRKRAEQRLFEAHQRMEHLLSESPAVVYTYSLNPEPELTFASRNLSRVLGWEPERFYSSHDFWKTCVHPDDLEDVLAKVAQMVVRGSMSYDYRFKHADGQYRWIHDEQHITAASGGRREVVGAFWDTTEQHRAEEALETQKRMLRTILDGVPDVIGLQKPDHTIIEYNRAGYRMLAKNPEDVIGRKCFEVTGRDAPCQPCATSLALKSGHNEALERYDPLLKRWFHVNAIPIVDESGKIVMVVEQLRDISLRREQEAELRRLASAIDHAVEAIVVSDKDYQVVYINPAFQTITGYSRVDIVGRRCDFLQNFQNVQGVMEDCWQRIESGTSWKGRLECRKKDGAFFMAEGSISPVVDETAAVVNYVCVLRDISAELKMEERLIQAQKMEAIGSLAGGIAHDFNNILFPLIGYAEMLREDLSADSPLQDSVNEIFNASIRARDLVKQILAFSRQSKEEKKPIRVQSVLKEVLKLVRATLPANIQIVQDIETDCPPILADPVQIHQVAMNLVTNAFHAMEADGGTLTVSLAAEVLDGGLDQKALLPAGSYAYLAIADTGCGVPADVLERIFEPYFTTKEQGKGTGLGLSVVHGIIQSHGGDITVASAPGRGTAFQVLLPCVPEAGDAVESQEPETVVGGNERILLVDDEHSILAMEQRMLQRLGYRVTAASSSSEALAVFRREPDRFDLVITDLTMPNPTGDRLARELRALRSDVPIIVCTGFSDKLSPAQRESLGIEGYLRKPVLKRALTREIRRVLKKSDSSRRYHECAAS